MGDPIEDLRRLADLPEDWDDEGASVIDPNAIATGIKLLTWLAETKLDNPDISPCADGSVDLHWKDDKLQLLVNIQHNGFGGDFYLKAGWMQVKGRINLDGES